MEFIKKLLEALFGKRKPVEKIGKPVLEIKGTKTKTAYQYAQDEIGTVEWAKGDNPEVVEYYAESGNSGIKEDAVPWCAAFVGAMLKRAGRKGTGKLNARSYLDWGTKVDLKDAETGDIVIFKRGNSSWQGHVGFFVNNHGDTISVLGGNQSDGVNIAKYRTSQLLGVRR